MWHDLVHPPALAVFQIIEWDVFKIQKLLVLKVWLIIFL